MYYERLENSVDGSVMSQQEIFFTNRVVVNGIIFSRELWLPYLIDHQNICIYEIVDIFLKDLNDIDSIFVVCRKYVDVTFVGNYGCYAVAMDSLQNEMAIIRVNEYLSHRQYTVKLHCIGDNYLFRCKLF